MRMTLVLLALLAGCGEGEPPVLGGDAQNGKLLLRQFGCSACHEIPGVAGGRGKVGPPLGGVAKRVYIAGVLPNTPERMASFIRHPQAADPRSAMPDMGVNEEHARDMVAYLYGLK